MTFDPHQNQRSSITTIQIMTKPSIPFSPSRAAKAKAMKTINESELATRKMIGICDLSQK